MCARDGEWDGRVERYTHPQRAGEADVVNLIVGASPTSPTMFLSLPAADEATRQDPHPRRDYTDAMRSPAWANSGGHLKWVSAPAAAACGIFLR